MSEFKSRKNVSPAKKSRRAGYQAARIKAARAAAEERQALCDALNPAQRLAKLDLILGPGVGAKKERAKLAQALAQAITIVPGEPESQVTEVANKEAKKAKKRSKTAG